MPPERPPTRHHSPSHPAKDTKELSKAEALRQVEEALSHVQNGEVIIKVQGGKPIWVDWLNRTRVG